MIPFVTEEICGHFPGAEGLLAAGPRCEAAAAPVDEAAEAEVGRADRGRPGAARVARLGRGQGRRGLPARLAAEGYGEHREHLARLARLSFGDPDGGEPVARSRFPAARSRSCASVSSTSVPRSASAPPRRAELEAEIERAERKLANDGFVAKAPPRWCRPSATSSRGCGPSSRRCEG